MCEQEFDINNCVVLAHPLARPVGADIELKLSHTVIRYFKEIGVEHGLSPERTMELYLRFIADTGFKIKIDEPMADDESKAAIG